MNPMQPAPPVQAPVAAAPPQAQQPPAPDQTQPPPPDQAPPQDQQQGQSATDAAMGDPAAWQVAAEADARYAVVQRPLNGQVG